MAEYTFVDIFATKGIEYLVVIMYFVLFVHFARTLNSLPRKPKDSGED